jgi:hypothetical protein
MRKFVELTAYALAAMVCLSPVGQAQSADGRLARSGVTQREGASLAHWSLLTGYGMPDAIGATGDDTTACLPDFTSQPADVSIGLFDRQELCDVPQGYDTGSTSGRLGLGSGYGLDADVAGAKFRLFGDGVFDQDSREGLNAVGVGSRDGAASYLVRTRLFLPRNVRVDTTVGTTKANPFGLPGFGGDTDNGYSAPFEGSDVLLLSRDFTASVAIRAEPGEPGVSRPANASDAFAVRFLRKDLSASLAFVGLGPTGRQDNQNGIYISLQGGF